jgi:hypothetical protein
MGEALVLVGEIFLLAVAQSIVEMFIERDKHPELARMANLACFAGSLLLVMHFVARNVMPELTAMFRFAF